MRWYKPGPPALRMACRDRLEVLWGHWQVLLAKSMSFKFIERHCVKTKVDYDSRVYIYNYLDPLLSNIKDKNHTRL